MFALYGNQQWSNATKYGKYLFGKVTLSIRYCARRANLYISKGRRWSLNCAFSLQSRLVSLQYRTRESGRVGAVDTNLERRAVCLQL